MTQDLNNLKARAEEADLWPESTNDDRCDNCRQCRRHHEILRKPPN